MYILFAQSNSLLARSQKSDSLLSRISHKASSCSGSLQLSQIRKSPFEISNFSRCGITLTFWKAVFVTCTHDTANIFATNNGSSSNFGDILCIKEQRLAWLLTTFSLSFSAKYFKSNNPYNSPFKFDYRQIYGNPEFENMVIQKITTYSILLGAYDELDKYINKIISIIEKELQIE